LSANASWDIPIAVRYFFKLVPNTFTISILAILHDIQYNKNEY
jgi:hypothetical protein